MGGRSVTLSRRDVEFFFSRLGEYRKRRDWYNFRCPFHQGNKFNFGLNIRTHWYNCFGCGESGSLRHLRGKLQDAAQTPISPLLVRDYGSSIPPPSSCEGDPLPSQTAISQEFWSRYRRLDGTRISSKSDEYALGYLASRGVSVRSYEVGLVRGMEGRVVFPFFVGDDVVYYQGRAFVSMSPKTLNPDSKKGWRTKSQVLWNYNHIHGSDTVVLCEGIFDAISVERKAKFPATCLLGKTISEKQKTLLRLCGVTHVYVFLDGDAQTDAWKLAVDLYLSKFVVRCVVWEKSESKMDPDLLPEHTLKTRLIQAREVDHRTELQLRAGWL